MEFLSLLRQTHDMLRILGFVASTGFFITLFLCFIYYLRKARAYRE